jgi:hypothetical protein
MARSSFSPSGLDIGNNSANMAYLYGISDFFSMMFQDTSRVNLLLESNAQAASDAYSKFLQLTSTISLEDIQTTLNQTLKLVTIKSTDRVEGQVNLYKLPADILSSRYIANRPLLPTTLLEDNVDFRIEQTDSGELRVRFAQDISNAGFSTRLLNDESTREYALWFVDTEIDEKWISKNYGAILGLDPETSTDAFKNLVYGLYYIYLNGPTLELLRKGLNLCLGVPLARGTETVLDVRRYLETDQYIVVTDSNQYLIPYGLTPTIQVDDVLNVGDELAKWVEIKDYLNDGDWWINLRIPASIIPGVPEGQENRYATRGSHFDYLMRTYLKKHTFLVNVNVAEFKNNQAFLQLSDVIRRAKPAYTTPIYIWTIPNDETVTLTETLKQRRDIQRHEGVLVGIEHFTRNETDVPHTRNEAKFMRYSVPNFVSRMCGTDTYVNGDPIPFMGGTATGFVNPQTQYRDNTDVEKAWLNTILSRGTEMVTFPRSRIQFSRSRRPLAEIGQDAVGCPSHHLRKIFNIPQGMALVPLYVTTQTDLVSKCDKAGIYTPDVSEWYFDLFNPFNLSESINSLAVDESLPLMDVGQLVQNFDIFRTRGIDVGYMGSFMPDMGFRTFTFQTSDLTNNDYLIGVRIQDETVGIYLVTANNIDRGGMYSIVSEDDPLNISFRHKATRGHIASSSSLYLLRGLTVLGYNNSMSQVTINDVPTYTDSENKTPMIRSRNGMTLTHRMELK